MTTRRQVTGVIAVAGAAAMLVAGCSSSENGVPVPGATSSASATVLADPAKAPTLVIGKADFPPGYQVMEVPRSQLKQAADLMMGSVRAAKFTPAKCGQVALFPDKFDLDKIGLVVAMKATSLLAETVVASDRTIADVRRTVTGDCSKVTFELTGGQAAGGRGTTVSKVVDVPKTKASDAIAIQQKSTVVLNGTTVQTTKILGFAEVNGYIVGVQAGDAGTDVAPDLAAFNSTFTKAVDTVAAKTK